MGRHKKPDQLKLLQGTARPDRMNPSQPEFDQVVSMDPPPYLSDTEKDIWNQLVPDFCKAGIMTTVDEPGVAMMAGQLSMYFKLHRLAESRVIKVLKGKNLRLDDEAVRALKLSKQFFQNAQSMMIQYGMTPVARQKMQLTDPDGGPKKPDALPPKPNISIPNIESR